MDDPNYDNKFFVAAKQGDLETIKGIPTSQVDVRYGGLGYTLLHLACGKGNEDIATHLVENCGADVNIKGRDGETALHFACSVNQLSIARKLVDEWGAKVDVTNRDGNTPLHNACKRGYMELVKLLIDKDNNMVNIVNRYGYNVLHVVSESNHLDIAMLLIKMRPQLLNAGTKTTPTPLQLACVMGNATIVRSGDSPLHVACQRKHESLVRYYVNECGADVDVTNKIGVTPLHMAIDDLPIVKLLVDGGANINARTCRSQTPLQYAKRNDRYREDVDDYLKRNRTFKNTSSVHPQGTTDSTYGCDANRRNDISLVLQLATSFMPAGWLGTLACVSRACRDMALRSYRLRLNAPMKNAQSKFFRFLLDANEDWYRFEGGFFLPPNQWCWMFHRWKEIRNGAPDEEESDGDEYVSDEEESDEDEYVSYEGGESDGDFEYDNNFFVSSNNCPGWKLEPTFHKYLHRESLFQAPPELHPAPRTIIKLAHCSSCPANGTMLVIAVRLFMVENRYGDNGNSLREGDGDGDDSLGEDEPQDGGYYTYVPENTRKEQWAVLYDITKASDEYKPITAQRLIGPIRPNRGFGGDYGVWFGCTVRSGNGQTFATVTGLPNNIADDEDDVAEVTIFKIDKTNQQIHACHTIQVDTFTRVEARSNIQMSLSTDGTVLSIFHYVNYEEEDCGGWTVYGSRSPDNNRYVKLIDIPGSKHRGYVAFTPDNEFVMPVQGWQEWVFDGKDCQKEAWRKLFGDRKDIVPFANSIVAL